MSKILNVHDTIIRPILTEKSTILKEQATYVFRVSRRANKKIVGQAIEKIYGVKVEKVRTMNVHGKWVRHRMHGGYRASWKKAIVTLKGRAKITALEDFAG